MDKEIKVGALSLGLTYAGCFFGAGYVSGKELFEFFGSFGLMGYFGILISILLFYVFGVLLIRNARLSRKSAFDEVIILKDLKVPRLILGIMTVFMMFGIFVIMTAGTGALINRVFDLPNYVGCICFAFVVCIAALFGIKGAVKVFSAIIPVLVISTLIICIIAFKKYGINFEIEDTNENPLLINWFFSAITYVSYNLITLIGTMIPVGSHIKRKRTALIGIGFGCMAALSLAVGIIMAVTSIFGASSEELPMLDIAFKIGNIFGFVYALLLVFAMFGTSLSSLVAINEYIRKKIPSSNKYIKYITMITGGLTFIFSLLGFGNLVNTVYPLFGYAGFIILLIIIINNIILKKNN